MKISTKLTLNDKKIKLNSLKVSPRRGNTDLVEKGYELALISRFKCLLTLIHDMLEIYKEVICGGGELLAVP